MNIFLAVVAVTGLCSTVSGFLRGFGSDEKYMKFGFSRDPKTFSHEIIAPWEKPFKPGYCASWEWNTEPRVRDERIKICHKLSGDRKHECNSPDGFCHDKCPFKNGSYPFWRLRNADTMPSLWALTTVQMFESPTSRNPSNKSPMKGYSSTFFGPGYYPSNAFDNNPESVWVSNGASSPGLNWIAYEFDHPVTINSIRIAGEDEYPDRLPERLFVEASCEKYFRKFSSQWVIENERHDVDKRYNKPRGGAGGRRN